MSALRKAAIGLIVCSGLLVGVSVRPSAHAQTVSVVGAGTGAAAMSRAGWTEIKWPFPIDEWGTGRAFVCRAADCGSEISLYLRGKAGFCNCTTGVTDDGDLDRVGDLTLLSDRFVGLAEGHPVAVDGMNGRSRPYEVSLPLWRSETAVAIALHAKCDALVATVVADRDQLAVAEWRALGFLGGDTVLHWAKAELGS
jgi:hypothetical protein